MGFVRFVAITALIVLTIGWILAMVEFGHFHLEYIQEQNVPEDPGRYVLAWLQYWIFSFGVPVTVLSASLHIFTKKNMFGVVAGITETVVATSLGGCMAYTTIFIHSSRISKDIEVDIIRIVGLVGEAISFLSLVVLIGIFPYLVAQANVNAVVKHKASHDQRTQVLPGFPPYNHHATHIIATDY